MPSLLPYFGQGFKHRTHHLKRFSILFGLMDLRLSPIMSFSTINKHSKHYTHINTPILGLIFLLDGWMDGRMDG